MNCQFSLAHIGINTENPQQAADLATLLSMLFNLEPRHGNKSEFAGKLFECMKTPYLGSKGHIALETENLDAAVRELEEKGFPVNMDTAAYREDGKLINIYLQGEFGGFAIHILQK